MLSVHMCRYNYTVYQDIEHGRQKIVKDGVDTLISVVDSVSIHFGTVVCMCGGEGKGHQSMHRVAKSGLTSDCKTEVVSSK